MLSLNLTFLFKELYENYGKQYWWPAKSEFEVCVGAILTQNTAWSNVEKAIANLRKNKKLSLKAIAEIEEKNLAELIKPAGYYNQKAGYLKNFCKHIAKNYNSDLDEFFSKPIDELRKELLSLKGIGNETADSIILYAAQKPIFVIDAYTKRIMGRIEGKEYDDYAELQQLFHGNLKPCTQIYNEFHALLVEHAKLYCKTKPSCEKCFLKKECEFAKNSFGKKD